MAIFQAATDVRETVGHNAVPAPLPPELARDAPRAELYGRPVQLSRGRVLLARGLSTVVAAAGAVYLEWRLSTLTGTGRLGIAFYAAECLNYAFFLMIIVLSWRPRWRTARPGAPTGTLDVFLPVCGEPPELVERSLVAALAIDYPHQTWILNDGHRAGKSDWQEIDNLARRHGALCLTRASGPKGKAANMNYALARSCGDFVVTIDSDHRAHPDLAVETLGYFADPDVAFVCSPQEFDTDESDTLNNRALLFHGYIQPARDGFGSAQSCGNATVYRRSALESIGGFSEWVSVCEDLHSSYRMHAKGWKSVYHARPLTRGLAPQTASAFAKQQLRWATDSLRIFLWDSPLFKRGLKPIQRLLYFNTTGYYMVVCTQLLFMAASALWLIWHVPIMAPRTWQEYLAYSIPWLGSLFLLLVTWSGLRGATRSLQSNLFMAPVFMVAFLRALTGVLFPPGVTEKLMQESRFSPLVVAQQAIGVLTLVAIGFAIATPDYGQSIAIFWAAFTVFGISGFATAVSRNRATSARLRSTVRVAAAIGAAVVILPIQSPRDFDQQAGTPPRWDGPRLALAVPASGAYLGVSSVDLASEGRSLAVWSRDQGFAPAIVHRTVQWLGGQADFPAGWADGIARGGAAPLITWEPWDGSGRRTARLADVAAGRYDTYIRRFARAAAEFGRPVLLRPLHDMNGSWYPWSVGREDGNSPELFVAAWRHLHDIFVQERATNVSWVWTVYSLSALAPRGGGLEPYYPGAAYVDWTSVDALNFAKTVGDVWRTPDELLRSTYLALLTFGKPVMVSELGSVAVGGNQQKWVAAALARLRLAYPGVKAVVWFDTPVPGAGDLSLGPGSLAAVRASTVAESPYWRTHPRLLAAARQGSQSVDRRVPM
jgi:cellulose synthase (UDP-forming)